MGGLGVCGVAALGFAAVSGMSLAKTALRMHAKSEAVATMLAKDRRERILLKLRTGFKPLRHAARKLLSVSAVDGTCEDAVRLLEESGIDVTKESLLSIALLGIAALAAVVMLLTMSVACALASACLAAVLVHTALGNRMEKRRLAMREQIPDALRAMSTCFRSGLSLLQTMKQVSKECGGALGKVFGVAARRLELGASASEALSVMRSGKHVPELAFVAVALDVQHQSGGSIAPVLEAARDSVNSELDLMRSLKVQTAQAKLSAGIVTVMPFLLVALFSLMSPDFLSPFFESLIGMALLALALIMQFTGVCIVRRMLKIDAG